MMQKLFDFIADLFGYFTSERYISFVHSVETSWYTLIILKLNSDTVNAEDEELPGQTLDKLITQLSDPKCSDNVFVSSNRIILKRYGLLFLILCLKYKYLVYSSLQTKLVLPFDIIEQVDEIEVMQEKIDGMVDKLISFVENEEYYLRTLRMNPSFRGDVHEQCDKDLDEIAAPLPATINKFNVLLNEIENLMATKMQGFFKQELDGYGKMLDTRVSKLITKIKTLEYETRDKVNDEFSWSSLGEHYLQHQHLIQDIHKRFVMPFFSFDNPIISERIIDDIHQLTTDKLDSTADNYIRIVELINGNN